MKRILVTLLILSLVFSFAGCGSKTADQGKKPEAAASDEIKIGIITSITGSMAKFGEAHKRAYDIALEEINAKGGVNGKKVRLIVEDDTSKQDVAMSAVEKLATKDNVPIIIGSYSSAATMAAATKATAFQVPLLIPTAADDNITEQGSKWVFRINAPSSVYASTMIDFLKESAKPKTLAIVYENTNFGTSTAKAAKEYAEKQGIKIVAYESYTAGAPDFKPLLTKVKKENPDGVFFVSYLMDATLLMRQAKEIDWNPQFFSAGGAGFSLADFISDKGAGPAAEYTLSVTQWMPDVNWPGAKEFAKKFKERYNQEPGYHAAQAYAALYVAVEALKQANSTDRNKVRDALANINMNTAFGPVKFDAKGQNSHPMLVTQVQKGQFVTVYPKQFASAQAILPTPAWAKRK